MWTHHTSPAITIWLTLLIPFTIWDSAYIFTRPESLPEGRLHLPFFAPYTNYATIDLMYSRQGWESGDGFVAAHCVQHLIEVALGTSYLWLVFAQGKSIGWLGLQREVGGSAARWAVVIGLAEGAMTAAMTVLCLMYEVFGGWNHVGHNDWKTLLTSWFFIVFLYFVFSVYQVYAFGSDIFKGLSIAGHDSDPLFLSKNK